MARPQKHRVLRLHTVSERSWAVVSADTGAIVTDKEGALVMRLTKVEAEKIAAQMDAVDDGSDPGEKGAVP